jgi:D-alanine transaminase
MPHIAYVNGRYRPHAQAAVHIEDRGYQFADGAYEVIAIHQGRMIDEKPHLDRLGRSLEALSMAWPMERRALEFVLGETIRRNRLNDGALYLQITRGQAKRDHAFPENIRPSLVVTVRRSDLLANGAPDQGVFVVTLLDERWKRTDIKSISLLPNVLAKQKAKEAGAFEAWLLDDEGCITEGTASNAWIVTSSGALVTRNAGHAILSGITRAILLKLAEQEGITLEERPFSLKEALLADEAFLTSTTSFVKPVIRIDDHLIGNGRVGPLTTKLAALYRSRIAHRDEEGLG